MTMEMVPKRQPVLAVTDLRTEVVTSRGRGMAVDGVSFEVMPQEALGIVGESGSGKSLTAMSIVRLVPAPAVQIVGGRIFFQGDDLLAKSRDEMRQVRGRRIGMMLQDAQAALNPVLTVGNQLREAIRHDQTHRSQRRVEMVERLTTWGIAEPRRRLGNYPHQLSGGTRQRVMGAIALAGMPELLIADEPTTALDATVQAAVLEELAAIQASSDLAILFISHDLGAVGSLCHRVAVMYAGRLVETGRTEQIFDTPAHPYTSALLRSNLDPQQSDRRLFAIPGYPPSIFQLGKGCPFAPRCPEVMQICREEFPPDREVAIGHHVSCWRHV